MKANLKTFALSLIAVAGIGATFTACNGSEPVYTLPSSATVRSFSLENDKNVLNNLDSVFFSIDLYNREIFNADSLPYGTKVDKLVPVVVAESASAIEFIVKNENGEEETFNYLENTTDTIDFTNPVKLKVVSYDGVNEAIYTVKVNVHKVETDTMVWSRIESSTLPTVFSAVNEQHTVMSPDGIYYCMTKYQDDFALAYTDNPGSSWNCARINLGFEANINSFAATNDALYILDTENNLYRSEDKGATWIDAETKANHLIGSYEGNLLATVQNGTEWSVMEYPAKTMTPIPSNFPVMNTSNPATVTFEMSTSPQLVITGGRKADGSLTPDTWGYDGKSWIKVSNKALPKALENVALAPYFYAQTDTVSWKVPKRTPVLLAIGGNDAAGIANDSIYMSVNYGLTWNKAPESLQIPASVIPPRTRAQALPYTGIKTETDSPSQARKSNAAEILTAWCPTGYVHPTVRRKGSRATELITEWDVPYIYIFGGVNANGATYNTVFRGVITLFTFKPLQ